ncbi:MAG: GNAT family N-acetyltransferase [Armatimonadota bacterium]
MNLVIMKWSNAWETDATLSSLIQLRRAVFVTEQHCPIEDEPDANDPDAFHVCAVESGVVIGCARMLIKDLTVVKIGRVAVARDVRKTGVGLAVMRMAILYIGSLGYNKIYLESQTHAIPFYERLGFVAYGPEFDDCNIPHRKMTLELCRNEH